MSEPKKHWLYGRDDRLYPIEEETNCSECLHVGVCDRTEDLRCSNFNWGTSDGHRGCQQCLHKYTRWDNKEPWPCFVCKDFIHKDAVDEGTRSVLVEFGGKEYWLDELKSRRDLAREEQSDG